MKAQGMQTKQIADVLSIHRRTVEFHLRLARDSLKAKNLYNAIAIAVKKGVIITGKLVIMFSLANAVLDPQAEVRRIRVRPIRVRNTRRELEV